MTSTFTHPLRATTAALAALLLSQSTAPALADRHPPPLQAAANAGMTRGVAYLLPLQREDGSFSQPQFPALTGLALWALAGSGRPEADEAIDRAVAFLVANAQPDGGIYRPIPGRRGGGLATYNTAVSLTALHATGRMDVLPTMLAARSFLAASQELEDETFRGGFGYDRDNERPYADLMNTHFTLEAMRRTQGLEELRPAGSMQADIRWDAALEYVLGLQNQAETGAANAGGFFYTHDDAKAGTETIRTETEDGQSVERVVLRSYGSITYAGLLAMVHSQLERDDPRVMSALEWASRHWTLEENPGMGQQGLYFFYNVIGRALDAAQIDALRRPEGEAAIEWRRELAERVLALQRDDGGWVNENGRFWESDPVLSTAYALIALQSALQP